MYTLVYLRVDWGQVHLGHNKNDIFLDDVLLIFKLKTITAMAVLIKCP